MIVKTGNISITAPVIRPARSQPLPGVVPARERSYLIGKRVFDIFFPLLVILFVLSWLLPLLCLLIRLDSPGPVIFRQKRRGRWGRVFTCYKLRTMILNPEADLVPATEGDRRITRVGRWLRKYNLDEMPQFFNVLSGSMSVIGPRPYMLKDCERCDRMVPDGGIRYRMKPGITGLAQVRGLHGVQATRTILSRRYRWDAYYVRHAGFRMDGQILLRTIRLFFVQKNHICR